MKRPQNGATEWAEIERWSYESSPRMKIARPIKFQTLTGYVAALAVVLCMGWHFLRSGEPAWQGHRLSEWIDAYDSHNRFDEGDGRRSEFSDGEIEQALEEMRPAALPVLLDWLSVKPIRLKLQVNELLNHQSFVDVRFEERDYRVLALAGIMAYHTEAQPLCPELLKLSRSPDPHTRLLGYEAAFFTWPDKEVFLPLAARALGEEDEGVQALAAQWMAQRFPVEAEAAGLRDRFPHWFEPQDLDGTSK